MSVKDIYNTVISYNDKEIADLVTKELDAGTDIKTILNEGLIAPMDEVGRLFSEGDLFIPEMLKAAQTMKVGLEVLQPFLTDTDAKPKGKVVIGTVKGDLHDIGKNLVAMMLEGAGFKITDLGVDVSKEKFLAAAQEQNADIVALSALLTTTMEAMRDTVATIKENSAGTKTIIGGAPVTQKFATDIGADGYAEDAPLAVNLAKKLLGI